MSVEESIKRVRLDPYRGGLSRPQLRSKLDHIDPLPNHSLTADELAQEARLRRYHFAKSSKQSTGPPRAGVQWKWKLSREADAESSS